MLMVSFITEPEPTGPQCSSRRHSCSRMGLARSASAGSAPINPISLPSRAGPVEPPTDRKEHTSELQSPVHLVCRLLLEKKNRKRKPARRGPSPTEQLVRF